ncbi:hypothetical protein HOY80DRAFT_1000049 [Tuber brumale]|nr:hypothetical protein HOY80DRAFT_1000049 [Tuber brumale]
MSTFSSLQQQIYRQAFANKLEHSKTDMLEEINSAADTPSEKFSTWRALKMVAEKPVFYYVMETQALSRRILGMNRRGSQRQPNSLVMDTLSNETRKDNAAVAYVYSDFSAQNLQSAKIVLASVLRQVVGALAQILDEV